MSDLIEPKREQLQQELERQVGAKEARKLKARQERHQTIWFGLGMFGMIGWTVVVPTIAGVAIGLWIDNSFPSRVSWTLTLLVVGVVIGSAMAWNWVRKESRHK